MAADAGRAFLVGTGPGDPGLVTVRALELIARADAILYDRLIPVSLLAHARDDALIEYAGKGHSGDSAKQAAIESRLLELVAAGKQVVRLKGGDPFVFGRGGEEAQALAAAGVDFEIVPAVTAGVGVASYAGIPLTHREHSAAVAFVTGHEDPTRAEQAIDWKSLAGFPGTIAIYMTVKNLAAIARRLIAGGMDPTTPAAVIEQGTTPRQRTVSGTLAEIGEVASEAEIAPPALSVIGPVVGVREQIAWFERRPLFGRRIAVTRSRAQVSRLASVLRELGADLIEAPAIATEEAADGELEAAVAELSKFDLVAFTSVPGVAAFFAALRRSGRDARALAGLEVAAVGAATAAALAERGIIADHVPERQAAEGLLDALGDVDGRRALLPQAADPRPVLAEGLRQRGAEVHQVVAYRTRAQELSEDQRAALADVEFVTFASGSAVHAIVSALGGAEQLKSARLVSIGPTTSAALREHGLEPEAEAERHDVDGLLDVLLGLA